MVRGHFTRTQPQRPNRSNSGGRELRFIYSRDFLGASSLAWAAAETRSATLTTPAIAIVLIT